MVCAECQQGFILSSLGLECKIPSSVALNCLSYDQASGNCLVCDPKYWVVSGKCEIKSIPECKEYQTGSAVLACKVCNDNFFLKSSNQCQFGSISKCRVYNNNGLCSTCHHGFALTSVSNLVGNYCMAIPEDLDCKQGRIDNSDNFVCEACNAGFLVSSYTDSQAVCFLYNEIPNCQAYSGRPLGFSCTLCMTGFWLDQTNSKCAIYRFDQDGCETPEPFKNKCKTCKDGFYLEGAGCKQSPIGIPNCKVYKDNATCRTCEIGYILQGSVCLLVNTTANCAEFDASAVCSKCVSGFLLNNLNQCDQLRAANCLTATDVDTCDTCPDGHKLAQAGSLTNCDKLNIAQCEQYQGEDCVLCHPGSYVSNSQCVQATAKPDCLRYAAETECSQCKPGYYLVLGGQSCIKLEGLENQTFANCDFVVQSSNGVCVICNKGHFFQNSQCTACAENTVSQGCSFCDPEDNSKCLICESDWQMTSTGGCEKNGSLDVNQTDTQTTNSGTTSKQQKASGSLRNLGKSFYDKLMAWLRKLQKNN